MQKDIADFALKTAQEKGVAYADVRLEESSGSGFLLKNGSPQISSADTTAGIAVRVLVEGSYGFGSTNILEKDNVRELVARAVKNAKSASANSAKINMADADASVASYTVKEKIPLDSVGAGEKLSTLMDIEKSLVSCKADVSSRFISYSDLLRKRYLLTSEGSKIESVTPMTSIFYMLTIEEGDRSTQRYWQHGNSAGFESVKAWELDTKLAAQCEQLSKNLKIGINAPKRVSDVVVGPEITGIMAHESMGHPYEADRVLGREAAQAGESFANLDMIGTKVANDALSVTDNPKVPGTVGYYEFDDEGIPAQRTFIIKEGILKSLLHNRESAGELGISSNGFARATGFDREPIIRMANTAVEPGDFSEDELVEGVKDGVFIKNFNEWNIDDRRLNAKYVGAECYLIKNGKITTPVINPALEIATPTLYKSIDATAKNVEHHVGTCGKGEPMQGIPVTLGGPSIRIRKVRLS